MTPPALPDSGDGRPPPAPDALPHPALWSDPAPAERPTAFRGQEEDEDLPPRTRGRLVAVYGAVVVMVLSAVLLGVAFVTRSLPLAAGALVLGLAALAVAVKERITSLVSVGQSPSGQG